MSLPRVCPWVLLVGLLATVGLGQARAEDVPQPPPDDPLFSGIESPSVDVGRGTGEFHEVAQLASRLTAYNSHDDARRATYTCCRPDQKEQIRRAKKANDAFLNLYPTSDFADNTLMHMARIARVERNFRDEMEAYQRLVSQFPTSDFVDDALWHMQQLHQRDSATEERIRCLQLLITQFPRSPYRCRAMTALAEALMRINERDAAIEVLAAKVREYPNCPTNDKALMAIGKAHQDLGEWEAAIAAYRTIVEQYPFSDEVDQAMLELGNCLRAARQPIPAIEVYQELIARFPGSPAARRAMREINALRPGAYNLRQPMPQDVAQRLFDRAKHHQNYGEYLLAVRAYQEFMQRFPGHDLWDDALFNIGKCFEELNILCKEINNAEGPEDLFKRQARWIAATGQRITNTGKKLQTASDAITAYLQLVAGAPGSSLRAEALYRIAKIYEEMEMPAAEAWTYQQLIINFPGNEHESEGMYRTLKYYAEHANYPEVKAIYAPLAAAFPEIFPPNIIDYPDLFRAMMKTYYKEAAFQWEEDHHHHIGYAMSPMDLEDDAIYFLGTLQISNGHVKEGVKRLALLRARPDSDHAAPALFCMARGLERLGRAKEAVEIYRVLVEQEPLSGLADDAQKCIEELASGSPTAQEIAKYREIAQSATKNRIDNYDMFFGKNVVVFMPLTVAPLVRAYNLPNIWDQAQESLAKWTGLTERLEEKQVILLDTTPGAQAGKVIRLCATDISDPPRWGLGLAQLAQNFISDPRWAVLHQSGQAMVQAFVMLAAANLQYDLVSETRDTIGSASAVKLPHENLVRQRERCLAALQDYVREGARLANLKPDAALGMLLALLDANGYGDNGLVDWTPYKRFFLALQSLPDSERNPQSQEQALSVLSKCLSTAFNTDLTPALSQWGFPFGRG